MELGRGKGEPKADQEKERLQYYLKALSAPMYDAKNVSIGEEHRDLIPGMVYNIGRSKSSCNIIFHDSRVSRQHCQLYVDPDGRNVYLIDGLVSEILKVNPEVRPVLYPLCILTLLPVFPLLATFVQSVNEACGHEDEDSWFLVSTIYDIY